MAARRLLRFSSAPTPTCWTGRLRGAPTKRSGSARCGAASAAWTSFRCSRRPRSPWRAARR
eukprot:11156617-Alexandrium_andersonii.AAC.1